MDSMSLYRKECRVTLIAFFVILLMTHMFPFYFLFPEMIEMTILGFPAHYFLTLVIGWIVLMPVYWIYIQVSDTIEDQIEETSSRAAELASSDAYSAQAAIAKGGAE